MTLIELIVVIAIFLVLASLLYPNLEYALNRGEQVVCTSKLRRLYLDFSDYLKDGNPWPQLPAAVAMGTVAEQQWWVSYCSDSMGLSSNDWRCPTYNRLSKASSNSVDTNIITYLPTLFDSLPTTPFNCMRMPWFTELGNLHHVGNLCVRGDGSVSPAQDP
jgi:prepilin-type N-terminal cleavage/methylation domain-containing protein